MTFAIGHAERIILDRRRHLLCSSVVAWSGCCHSQKQNVAIINIFTFVIIVVLNKLLLPDKRLFIKIPGEASLRFVVSSGRPL